MENDRLLYIYNNSSYSLNNKLSICEDLYNNYIPMELKKYILPDIKSLIIIELRNQIINDIYNQALKVYRSDIIGKYVGWTAHKTAEFLKTSKSNIIIIYGDIYYNDNDSFGLEAIMGIEHHYRQNPYIMMFKDTISL